jgi:sporulation protein YlmC with PRC-barrel domain
VKTSLRLLDAGFHLLDRQVIDRDGRMVCKVDDLELEPDAGGQPVVTAILAGPAALGPRIGGRLGRWMVAVQARLRPRDQDGPARIAFAVVEEIRTDVVLSAARAELRTYQTEEWVARRVIGKLPGADHAGQ